MKLIAHRGASGHWPENTLYAFSKAIASGWVGAELDVRLSKDGVPMVHHDALLNPQVCRDAAGTWLPEDSRFALADLTAKALSGYQVGEMCPGSDYAAKFVGREQKAGLGIPSLREVLALGARQPDFLWVVEFKSDILKAEQQLWQPVLSQTLPVLSVFPQLPLIGCGFDWNLLRALTAKAPAIPCWFTTHPLPWLGLGPWQAHTPKGSEKRITAMQQQVQTGQAPWFAGFDPANCTGSMAERIAKAIAAAGGTAWFMHHADASREAVAACHQAGILACGWSGLLRDAAEYRRLESTGLDYFCTDLSQDAVQ